MKSFITNPIFRWIAVLPGAFLAAVAAMFPWHWVVLFYASFVGKFEGEETLGLGTLVRIVGPETVERLGYGFIVPFVMITIAAKVAQVQNGHGESCRIARSGVHDVCSFHGAPV